MTGSKEEEKKDTTITFQDALSTMIPNFPLDPYLLKFLMPHNGATFCIGNKLLTYVSWGTL